MSITFWPFLAFFGQKTHPKNSSNVKILKFPGFWDLIWYCLLSKKSNFLGLVFDMKCGCVHTPPSHPLKPAAAAIRSSVPLRYSEAKELSVCGFCGFFNSKNNSSNRNCSPSLDSQKSPNQIQKCLEFCENDFVPECFDEKNWVNHDFILHNWVDYFWMPMFFSERKKKSQSKTTHVQSP